jgi:hypothetical protein
MPDPAYPEALLDEIRALVGCDDTSNEFVFPRTGTPNPPPALQNPADYQGSNLLSISLNSQVPARQRQAWLREWCQVLPSLTDVQWLWLGAPRVSQELFGAACRLPALKGLDIGQSAICSLEPLRLLAGQLEVLVVGSSPSIVSIEPLAALNRLRWLRLDNVVSAHSLSPLQALTGLQGLGLTGLESSPLKLETLAPLAKLAALQWLHLGAIRVIDESLRPLAGLSGLRFLGLSNRFPVEEFARLSLHIGPEVCEWCQPFNRAHSSVFPCRTCKINWRVQPAGLGSKLLCPTCDTKRLAGYITKFRAARDSARREQN